MTKRYFSRLLICLLLVFCLTLSGVCATWVYVNAPTPVQEQVNNKLSEIHYGTLYITQVTVSDGNYESAQAAKIGDLNIFTDLTLKNSSTSSATVQVTFYNSTDVSYYYNKTETTSYSNESIGFTVSGIEKQDEVPPKSFRTVTVTFVFDGNTYTARDLTAQLHFNFVVDKDSIGDIVALTAVDQFRNILNNITAPDSYETLTTAMDNRSGFNKASAVTYIGNVTGSNSTDSKVIQTLFGDEFMQMDLDGDGEAERITMMIKREDLDDNDNTGDEYSYSSWGNKTTVYGAEMTLYITAQDLTKVSSNQSVVVYAASFTKLPGNDVWTDLVSLTKGTAKANNYSGYGSANSFNTDTWTADNGKTMKQLAQAAN